MNLNEISYDWLVGFRHSTFESVYSRTDWHYVVTALMIWTHFRGEINAPTINRIYMHIAVQAKVMAEYESN